MNTFFEVFFSVYSFEPEGSHSGLVHSPGKTASRKGPRVRISHPPHRQSKESTYVLSLLCRANVGERFERRKRRDVSISTPQDLRDLGAL